MKHTRVLLAAGFAGILGLGLMLTRGGAQPNTVKQIAPGVWFREGDLKNMGHCNNIIIEMKDYLIVVDANFPSGARLAMEDAHKVSTKPVKYVFDTHHHGDHAYGNPVWTKAGATTLAYVGVVEEMKRDEPGRWQAAAKARKDVAELNLPTAEPPRQTFSARTFTLKDSTRTVEFRFLGWAHTRGDGFVWLPKEKILCTGDAVANGPHNAVMDANMANWPKVVEEAMKLKPEHVLPGHGAPGGPEVLTGQRDFFVEMYKSVQASVKSGKKLEDIVTLRNGAPAATSVRLPQSVQNWVGPSLPVQVKATYDEITQGKPAGALPRS